MRGQAELGSWDTAPPHERVGHGRKGARERATARKDARKGEQRAFKAALMGEGGVDGVRAVWGCGAEVGRAAVRAEAAGTQQRRRAHISDLQSAVW